MNEEATIRGKNAKGEFKRPNLKQQKMSENEARE